MGSLNLELTIDSVPFVFLDTETTGLSPEFGDRICEIGMLKSRQGEVLETYHSLINPSRPISAGASAINGITDDMVEGKPYFKDILDKFLDFIKDSVIVIHNAPFDLGFLATQLRILRKPMMDNPVIDSLYLARKYYRFRSNRLSSIGNTLGLTATQLHRAYGDVALLKEIFEFFLKDFMERDVRTVGDLLKLQDGPIQLPKQTDIVLPPALEEALQSHKTVLMYYIDSNGNSSKRKVEPIDVQPRNDYIYLVAHCHLRNDQRTFRLDRIINMEIL